MTRRLSLFVGGALLMLPLAAFAGPNPGEWQVTTEFEMAGVPSRMPPVTMSTCITKEQSESPEKAIPHRPGDNNCKMLDVKTDGSKMTWNMKCEGPHPAVGNGEMHWGAETYDGWMTIKVADHDVKVTYKGKRVGDCKK